MKKIKSYKTHLKINEVMLGQRKSDAEWKDEQFHDAFSGLDDIPASILKACEYLKSNISNQGSRTIKSLEKLINHFLKNNSVDIWKIEDVEERLRVRETTALENLDSSVDFLTKLNDILKLEFKKTMIVKH